MKNFIIHWISDLTARFHALNPNSKRRIAYGTVILLMLLTVGFSFSDSSIGHYYIGTISNPMIIDANDQTMKQEQLIPIGKMKGEINGEFDSFYVAVDKQARIFINRDIEYGSHAYNQSNQWEEITRAKLREYEQELAFLPFHQKSKSLKP